MAVQYYKYIKLGFSQLSDRSQHCPTRPQIISNNFDCSVESGLFILSSGRLAGRQMDPAT